ncbi:MAG: hypothetical protein WBP93_07610 [Pyrinomonadaceae bacterium]
MRKSIKTQYQAKVIDDQGLSRAKVPAPLIRVMGARPADYLIFRLTPAGQVTLHVSRSGKRRGKATARRS